MVGNILRYMKYRAIILRKDSDNNDFGAVCLRIYTDSTELNTSYFSLVHKLFVVAIYIYIYI